MGFSWGRVWEIEDGRPAFIDWERSHKKSKK
jgi:hypothetical protein